MAREIHRFAVSTPAGTLPGAPQLTNLAMPPREVTDVEILVPPGPRGEVGFALAAAGNPIIPYEPGAWIVTDDEIIKWPLSEQIDSGAWQLRSYNTGAFPHVIEVRFLTELPGLSPAQQTAGALLPLASLQPTLQPTAIAPLATPAGSLPSGLPVPAGGEPLLSSLLLPPPPPPPPELLVDELPSPDALPPPPPLPGELA